MSEAKFKIFNNQNTTNMDLFTELSNLLDPNNMEDKTLTKNETSQLDIGDVSSSLSFEDWLTKYFETPKMKMMYKRKDGKGEFDREKLFKGYKRAYKVGS